MEKNSIILGAAAALAGSATLGVALVGGSSLGAAFAPSITNNGIQSAAVQASFEQREIDDTWDNDGTLNETLAVSSNDPAAPAITVGNFLPSTMNPASTPVNKTFKLVNTGAAGDLRMQFLDSDGDETDAALSLMGVRISVNGTDVDTNTLRNFILYPGSPKGTVLDSDFANGEEVTVHITGEYAGDASADEVGKAINDIEFKFVNTVK